MTDAILKPCPFCGCVPKYEFIPEEDFGEWDTHNISCCIPNHHSVQVIAQTKEEAIEIWNTRAALQTDRTELLREALTMCLATFEMFSEAAAGDISSSDLANAVNKSIEMATAALGETK
jgi:Lar family restriction alleviation protein